MIPKVPLTLGYETALEAFPSTVPDSPKTRQSDRVPASSKDRRSVEVE